MAQSSNKILCDFIKLRILWANSPFNFTIHVFCIQHIWTHLSIFMYDKISAWRQTINKYVEDKWSSLYVSHSILLFNNKQSKPDSLFVLLYHILKYVGVTFTILHLFSFSVFSQQWISNIQLNMNDMFNHLMLFTDVWWNKGAVKLQFDILLRIQKIRNLLLQNISSKIQ